MPQLLSVLPSGLEDGAALIARRKKAEERKEMWRSLYSDCFRYAMPARESWALTTPGQFRNHNLLDSKLKEATYTAANTMTALLFPGWTRWAELSSGGAIANDKITQAIRHGLQESTEIFFDFLNHSNFETVISETALELQVGTGALQFDEGDSDDDPFLFSAIPLSAIELEEGPRGTIETTWMKRCPVGRNLLRMYPGMEMFDLPLELAELLSQTLPTTGWERPTAGPPDRLQVWFPDYIAQGGPLPTIYPSDPATVPAPAC
jgi:hypothetical protein